MVGAIQNPARLGTLTASEISLLASVNQLPTERRHTLRLEPPAGHATISAPFLRWLLLEAVPALRFPAFRVELRNATIAGLLDLSRATLPLTLCFRNCRFASGLDLTEARTGSFEMIGGSAAFVNANRMNSEGALLLRAPLENPAGGGDQIPKGWLIIEKDLRLAGARIRGNLDLRGCSVGHAESPGRNHIAVRADGLKVDGSVRLTNGFRAIGQVSLNGARIERNLNCSGAVLWNPGGYSLSAAGAHIAGSLYTRSAAGHHGTPVPFLSDGAFRLEGARIVGDWKAGGAHFVAPATRKSNWNRTQANILELRAIMANGLTVNATVSLDAACHIRGTAEFINAKIGGDLNCNGAIFDFPGEEVLYADGITISGTFFLENARVNGLLRLVLATISQDFFVNKTIFDLSRPFRDLLGDLNVSAEELGLDVCGIYAPTSRVGGSFYWRRIRKSFHQEDRDLNRRLLLSVLDADAERVEDDRESWELLDQIDVRNCRYQSIANLTGDTMWRAELLDLAYAPINQFPYDRAVRRTAIQKKLVAFRRSVMVLLQGRHRRLNGLLDYAILTFAPQPYMQLARVVHRTGYEAVANDIMVRMERNRTRYSGFGRWRQLGRWVSDILIRYGFSPLRPVWFLLGWTVVSAVIFEYAFANNRMRPTFENLENDLKPGEARYEFNPVIYALDTLVPLIDLNQKKNWHVEPLPEVDQKMARHRAEAMKEHPASLLMAFWRLRYSLPNSPIGFLVLFNTFFGWVLTTFLAAGVTGVLRSKPANEGGSDSGQE